MGLIELHSALVQETYELKKGTVGWLAGFSGEKVGDGVNGQSVLGGPSVRINILVHTFGPPLCSTALHKNNP